MFDANNNGRLPVPLSVSIRIRTGSDRGFGMQDLGVVEE
jgi:hypothetical protein